MCFADVCVDVFCRWMTGSPQLPSPVTSTVDHPLGSPSLCECVLLMWFVDVFCGCVCWWPDVSEHSTMEHRRATLYSIYWCISLSQARWATATTPSATPTSCIDVFVDVFVDVSCLCALLMCFWMSFVDVVCSLRRAGLKLPRSRPPPPLVLMCMCMCLWICLWMCLWICLWMCL
jgi:hypothetical protein